MDRGETWDLCRRNHGRIRGQSTTGTRARRADRPARKRGGGEFPHRAESAPARATRVRHRRALLGTVGGEESPTGYLVLGSGHLRSQHQGALGYADRLPAPARPADRRVVVASEVGRDMKLPLLLAMACVFALDTRAAAYYSVVAGLGGEPDYEQRFTTAVKDLDRILRAAGPTAHVYALAGAQATSRQLAETMSEVARTAKADDDFALILIGHGSFDGVEYKFNLVGPDVTAREIASMCDHVAARRQLVVDTTSASGGAVQVLERPGRAVIAATKSGTEKNATVFARYWVEALEDPA